MKFFKPSVLRGGLRAPPSKSFMVRAVAAGILAEKSLEISNFIPCGDSDASVGIAEVFGKKVFLNGNSLFIKGNVNFNSGVVANCGESALTLRLLTPIASLYGKEVKFIGEESLNSRPVWMMKGPLETLGGFFLSDSGTLPVTVRGGIRPGVVEVDGNVTSQFLSGLLMALPLLNGDSTVVVNNLNSVSYVDMTLQLLNDFGIEIINTGYTEFNIPGMQNYSGGKYIVEGDWSGASFHFVMGALSGEVSVAGLNSESAQGDKRILEVVGKVGGDIDIGPDRVKVRRNRLTPFEFDATGCPDLFPPLVALASGCDGTSEIRGVKRLKFKESNRGDVLKKEFGALGVEIQIDSDVMKIKGGSVKGGKVSSHNDHRIAMSLVAVSTIASGQVDIDDVLCIEKSYPDFLKDYKSLCVNK